MKKFFAAFLITAIMFAASGEVLAKRGGGFSSRSSSSRSSSWGSRSKSTPSKSYSKPSSYKSTSTRSSTTKKATSKVDNKQFTQAKKSGKAFTSTKAAKSDFKSKMKSDPKTQEAFNKSYPTKYDKEPATRPSHIPQNYSTGGNTYNVTYQNGGYGYNGPNGWTMLTGYMLMDTMSDAMMMSAMTNQGYYVGSPTTTVTRAVPVNTGPSLGTIFLIVTLLIVACIVLIVIMSSMKL